ncbi:hypothetical protein D1872_325890 [compost metagenome]
MPRVVAPQNYIQAHGIHPSRARHSCVHVYVDVLEAEVVGAVPRVAAQVLEVDLEYDLAAGILNLEAC